MEVYLKKAGQERHLSSKLLLIKWCMKIVVVFMAWFPDHAQPTLRKPDGEQNLSIG